MGRRRKFKSGGSESEVTIDKSKKYKWDSKGDFVSYTGDAGKNEITVSGSKSSLRRLAEIERNIGILATTLTTSDDGTDDGNNASFSKNVNQTTRFKKAVRMDKTLNMQETIDMNGDKITEVGTCTLGTDAANKTYVDAQVSGLIDGAPTTLNTLNELAAALNDNADVLDTFVTITSAQALGSAANVMTISGHTITLARADGSTDVVVVPDNNDNTTYSVQDGELSQVSFTTADNSKLDGIEASADVTDTANVTSAGALMKTGGTMSADIAMGGNDITGAGTFYGIATTAQYADLAERYAADAPYEEGTVVMFGGEAEVTSAQGYGSTRIAGVVSTNPAFKMNSEAGNSQTHPYIALQGRVPCKVTGTVSKGDILVASEVSGTATIWLESSVDPRMTAYVGIAIEDKTTDGVGYVEVKVGK
jgi:hypothetical protein